MRGFVETALKPYYLHHGDLAPGTSHLRLSLKEGQALVRALLGRVSGLCQPIYVVDIPGGHGKAPIGPVYAARAGDGWQIEDWHGKSHHYADLRPKRRISRDRQQAWQKCEEFLRIRATRRRCCSFRRNAYCAAWRRRARARRRKQGASFSGATRHSATPGPSPGGCPRRTRRPHPIRRCNSTPPSKASNRSRAFWRTTR